MIHSPLPNENPVTLYVTFESSYSTAFDVEVTLIDDNKTDGLLTAWKMAIQNYCNESYGQLNKQLKRKLGSIYHYNDIARINLSFINQSGKREKITIASDYVLHDFDDHED